MTPADRADPFTVSELLWRREAAPAKAERPRLDIDSILASAIAIADAEGLDALSMQQIANDLRYTPMALYRHVPSKVHLLVAMTDAAYGTPPVPPGRRRSWRAEVELWVTALWRVYGRHPWLIRTPTTSAPIGPNALAWTEARCDRWRMPGCPARICSPQRRSCPVPCGTWRASPASWIRQPLRITGGCSWSGSTPTRFPIMAELANATFENDEGDVAPMVWFGLRRLMDGIDAYARTART